MTKSLKIKIAKKRKSKAKMQRKIKRPKKLRRLLQMRGHKTLSPSPDDERSPQSKTK